MSEQGILFEAIKPACPYAHLVDHDNTHCDVHILEADNGYETVGENSFNRDDWEMDIRGMQLDDVVARDTVDLSLPHYIPNVPRGNKDLYIDYAPEYVTVNLGKIVSPVKLKVAASLTDLLGVPSTTKVIIQSYGKDMLIENIWPERVEVFRELSRLRPYAITSVNYSIWDSQNHFEQLMNIKRGLLTFELMQDMGLPAILHIYWAGLETLRTWARWIGMNPSVNTVAINLQTMRKQSDWEKAMRELRYFAAIVPRQLHYLITGPITIARIREVKDILGSVTLSNGYPAYKARAHYQLGVSEVGIYDFYSPSTHGQILSRGVTLYDDLMQT